MSTIRDVITDAFIEAGILAAGESLSAEDASFGLRKLNRLIDSWAANGLMLSGVGIVPATFTILAGTSNSTIGTSGAINLTVPLYLKKAYINLNNQRYEMEIVQDQKWSEVTTPTLTGMPRKFYCPVGGENSQVAWWPVADQNYTVEFFALYADDPSTLTQTFNGVHGAEEMIIQNLAVALCGQSYGVQATPEMIKAAQDSYLAQVRLNFQPVIAVSDLGPRGAYNINTRSYEV